MTCYANKKYIRGHELHECLTCKHLNVGDADPPCNECREIVTAPFITKCAWEPERS